MNKDFFNEKNGICLEFFAAVSIYAAAFKRSCAFQKEWVSELKKNGYWVSLWFVNSEKIAQKAL